MDSPLKARFGEYAGRYARRAPAVLLTYLPFIVIMVLKLAHVTVDQRAIDGLKIISALVTILISVMLIVPLQTDIRGLDNPGFPRHLFRLRVSTAYLVAAQMGLGITGVVTAAAAALLVHSLVIGVWLLGPLALLFSATAAATALAVVWAVVGFVWTRAFTGIAVGIALLYLWPLAVSRLPQTLSVSACVIVMLVAWGVSRAVVERDRSGGAWAGCGVWWQTRFGRASHPAPRVTGLGARFHSAFRAQLWHEWMLRHAAIVRIVVVFLVLLQSLWIVLPSAAVCTMNRPQMLFALVLLGPFLAPLSAFNLTRGVMPRTSAQPFATPLYLWSRPVTSRRISAAALLAMTGMLCVTTTLLTALILHWLGWGNIPQWYQRFGRDEVVWAAFTPVAAIAVAWTSGSISITVALTGRVGVWNTVCFTLLGGNAVLVIPFPMLGEDAGTRFVLSMLSLLSWFVAAIICAVTVGAFLRAVGSGLLGPGSAAVAAAIGVLVAVLANYWLLLSIGRGDPGLVLLPVVPILLGVLAGAPVILAPLAVAWNRHQ
ncbi:MAG: hypothetical protein N2111_00990 [Candidatus Sumerlaeaceae bacterium]|nr:hypothetical protein [Candidatus Sumerlaeaceae bacterium]